MAVDSSETRHENRLAREVSPYLRQHADNPVDWYPWGDEALREAKVHDKPILLSIGYSACHWCHVMEHESFEDSDIAQLMNELFVNIKVDREERPDLDQVYQMVVQLMGRHGGWPLTVFLTPELKPFFAGTYFPATDRYGMPGLPQVLRAVADAYHTRREEVERSAGEIADAIAKVTAQQGEPSDPPQDIVERSARALAQNFDDEHGGFGSAPKFPNTLCLDVMLRAYKSGGDTSMRDRVQLALDRMHEGGVYDQLGGGFHRYSVDERWAVPHFEKMLYDNALLARFYVEGWRATGEPRFADTARETLEYVLREMRSPEGGFYSSQDADSEGVEGKFFVWTPEQFEEVLGPQDARIARLYWGVAPGGNFEHGTTVLHVSRSVRTVAEQAGCEPAEVRQVLERARRALFEAREQRVRPFRDEKVIAAWNGMMIGAFAEAGGALGEPRYTETAREALEFVRRTLWQDPRLRRIYKDGQARVDAFLDDYAEMACAAIDVYEATFDESALTFAQTLADAAIERFADDQGGGFFFTPASASDLLVRAKDSFDHAVPSGASSMCRALLRLHALTRKPEYLERAEQTMRGTTELALQAPFGFGHMIGAMDQYVHGETEVLVVAAGEDPQAEELCARVRRHYLPTRVLARVSPEAPEDAGGAAALLEGQRQQDGRATVYVCRERTCSRPVTEPDELEALLP